MSDWRDTEGEGPIGPREALSVRAADNVPGLMDAVTGAAAETEPGFSVELRQVCTLPEPVPLFAGEIAAKMAAQLRLLAIYNGADGILRLAGTDGIGAHPVPAVGRCTLAVRSPLGEIMGEDEKGRMATVTGADMAQSNGVIHVIDRVLLPAQ